MTIAYKHEKFTYEDYQRLPNEPRVELIEGEFLVCPAPSLKHQRILRALFMKLVKWVEERDLGEVFFAPTDVVLSRFNVVQPDLLFVSKERASILGELNLQGAPDLAIEVLSPKQEARDRILKKGIYEKFDVQEYWIVDPERENIMVMVRGKNKLHVQSGQAFGARVKSVILPGFEIDSRDLFRERKP